MHEKTIAFLRETAKLRGVSSDVVRRPRVPSDGGYEGRSMRVPKSIRNSETKLIKSGHPEAVRGRARFK